MQTEQSGMVEKVRDEAWVAYKKTVAPSYAVYKKAKDALEKAEEEV